ncbi:hypothetical protein HDV05_002702 [Chytridiales sp. JEL 0842]|nr:hypothetical protein HDV05_002702 [Chytridiales sp. JEL 0842]
MGCGASKEPQQPVVITRHENDPPSSPVVVVAEDPVPVKPSEPESTESNKNKKDDEEVVVSKTVAVVADNTESLKDFERAKDATTVPPAEVETLSPLDELKSRILGLVADTGMAPAVECLVWEFEEEEARAVQTLQNLCGLLCLNQTFGEFRNRWMGLEVQEALAEEGSTLCEPLKTVSRVMEGAVDSLDEVGGDTTQHPLLKVGFVAIGSSCRVLRSYESVEQEIVDLFQSLVVLSDIVKRLSDKLCVAASKESDNVIQCQDFAKGLQATFKLQTSCLAFCTHHHHHHHHHRAPPRVRVLALSPSDKARINVYKSGIESTCAKLEATTDKNVGKAFEEFSRLTCVLADTIALNVVQAMQGTLQLWARDVGVYLAAHFEQERMQLDAIKKKVEGGWGKNGKDVVSELITCIMSLRKRETMAARVDVWDDRASMFLTLLVSPPSVDRLKEKLLEHNIAFTIESTIHLAERKISRGVTLLSKLSESELADVLKTNVSLTIAIMDHPSPTSTLAEPSAKSESDVPPAAEELDYRPQKNSNPNDNTNTLISVDTHDPLFPLRHWLNPVDVTPDLNHHAQNYAKGTRTWTCHDIHTWLSSHSSSPVLWLNAGAGWGKSVVAWLLTQNLGRSCTLGSVFFFRHDDEKKRSVGGWVRTMAFDLAGRVPGMKSFLEKKRVGGEKSGERLFVFHEDPVKVFRELIVDGLLKLEAEDKLPTPLLLIVDALDECCVGQDKLLAILKDSSVLLPKSVKIFTTSRPENLIYQTLADINADEYVPLDSQIEQDLLLYIEQRLDSFYGNAFTVDTTDGDKQTIVRELLKTSGNTFVVPKIILDDLQSRVPPDSCVKLVDQVAQYSQGISALYMQILSTRVRSNLMRDFERVMKFVLTLKEPMDVPTLAAFSGMHVDQVDAVLQALSTLVKLDAEEKLVVFHKSFADFLLSKSDAGPFYIDTKSFQSTLTLQLLNILTSSEHMKRGVSGAENTISKYSPTEQKVKGPSEFLYAAKHWVDHACFIPANGLQDQHLIWKKMDILTSKHLLSWGELLAGLNLLSKLKSQVNALVMLPTTNEQQKKTLGVFKSFGKLLLYFELPMTFNPHQIYASALTLCPDPILRELYSDVRELPHLIYGRDQDWPPLIRDVFDPKHEIHNGMYTPDGTQLAYYTKTFVRFEDLRTSTSVFEIHDKDSVIQGLRFSPADSNRMLLLLWGMKVQVWDVPSQKCLRTIQGGGGISGGVAFSSTDPNVVALASKDTVSLWNVENGQCTKRLKADHLDCASLQSVPLNGGLVALSCRNSVVVWDLETDQRVEEYSVPERMVFAGYDLRFAFHPQDPNILVVADKAIFVFDRSSKEIRATINGCGEKIVALALHPTDPNLILAAYKTDQNMFQLWNVEDTSQPLRTFVGHSSTIISLQFHPADPTQVISASSNGTCKIWDTLPTPSSHMEIHEGSATTAVVSSLFEPHIFATGSASGVVRIWDLNKERYILEFQAHEGPVELIAFSETHAYLLGTTCKSNIVSVWDLSSKSCLCTLTDVASFKFCSSENPSIVTTSATGETKHWDLFNTDAPTKIRGEYTYPPQAPPLLSVSSTGRVGVVSEEKITIDLYNTTTPEEGVPAYPISTNKTLRDSRFSALTFSALEPHVLAGGSYCVANSYVDEHGTCTIWDANTGRNLQTIQTTGAKPLAIQFSKVDREFVSVESELYHNTVRVLDVVNWTAQPGAEEKQNGYKLASFGGWEHALDRWRRKGLAPPMGLDTSFVSYESSSGEEEILWRPPYFRGMTCISSRGAFLFDGTNRSAMVVRFAEPVVTPSTPSTPSAPSNGDLEDGEAKEYSGSNKSRTISINS